MHRFFAVRVASGKRTRGAVAYERAVTPEVIALLREYVVGMGASPEIVALASATGSSSIRHLSREELRRYRIVTQGEGIRRVQRARLRPRD